VGSALPISLLHFNAENSTEGVKLDWVTASETNNDFFNLERSKDGSTFEALETLKGSGNTNELISYSTIDKNPIPGICYYRLKQTDYNSNFSYSPIIAIYSEKKQNSLTIVPNPGGDLVTINFYADDNDDALLNIFDNKGRLISTKAISISKGSNLSEINLSSLSKGVYFISISSGSSTLNKTRFIKI